MNITAAKYANASGGILLVRDNGVDLYVDGGELYDRAKAGEFGPLGELPQPEPEVEPVPQVVSAFQALQALDDFGFLDLAEAEIAKADAKSQRAFHKASEFRRTSPTVAAIAASVGITEAQLDDLFRHAATIEA